MSSRTADLRKGFVVDWGDATMAGDHGRGYGKAAEVWELARG